MQCEGETDDGGLKYSNTMPAQYSHTVCVHLYHLEHSRTAPRPPRDQPESTPFPFAFGLPSPCRLQLKLENLCTNSLKQECLCVLYVLVSVPHMPFPSLPQLCLSPSPSSSPSSILCRFHFVILWASRLFLRVFLANFRGTRTTKCNEISRVLMT